MPFPSWKMSLEMQTPNSLSTYYVQVFLLFYILLSFQQLCPVAVIAHFLHQEAEVPKVI